MGGDAVGPRSRPINCHSHSWAGPSRWRIHPTLCSVPLASNLSTNVSHRPRPSASKQLDICSSECEHKFPGQRRLPRRRPMLQRRTPRPTVQPRCLRCRRKTFSFNRKSAGRQSTSSYIRLGARPQPPRPALRTERRLRKGCRRCCGRLACSLLSALSPGSHNRRPFC